MMQTVNVDGLLFEFPDHWLIAKLDDWPFYRKHFASMWDGIKAVDLGVIHDDALLLIEAKDYRASPQPGPADLIKSVGKKVADSLACLMAAQHNAHDRDHQKFAAKACRCRTIRVVFHLEQRYCSQRRLATFRPRRANRTQQELLQQLIQPIDRRARVVSGQRCYPLP